MKILIILIGFAISIMCLWLSAMVQGKPLAYVLITLLALLGGYAAERNAVWLWLLGCVLCPVCTVLLRPEREASFLGVLARELIRKVVSRSGRDVLYGIPPRKQEPAWQPPDGYSYQVITLSNAKLELIAPPDAASGKLVYQIHGGGYVEPLTNARRDVGVRFAKLCGCSVAMLDYRIAPEAVYPAALQDAREGWNMLLELGYLPENIALAGDSAGGNLLLALTMQLRDDSLQLPCAIFAMAPLGDFGARGTSFRFNLYRDAVLGKPKDYLPLTLADGETPKFAYAGDADPDDPYLSPTMGDFTGFPPMLLQTGTHDLLLSDTLAIAQKAKDAGCIAEVSLCPGMVHAYQFGPSFIRECRMAWQQAQDWLCSWLYPKASNT